MVLLAVFLIARGIVRPLSGMVRAAGKIGPGDFDGQVVPTSTDREIRLLAEAFHLMQRALKERERRLTERNQELDAANRDYQELLSFVTHELNNSIGSLLLNMSLLEEEAVEGLQRWIRHRDFELRWDWPEEVVIHGDADLLDIVYSNFVVNALKYGSHRIQMSARRDETHWILGVGNGGAPIAPEKIPLLFAEILPPGQVR